MISNEIKTILKSTSEVLNKHRVEYMLIGGTAVAYYGYQRISGGLAGNLDLKYDLDFWYNPTTSNYYKLLKALKELKIDISSLERMIFDPKKTYLRIPHQSFRTEFLPQMKGLNSFNESLRSAILIQLEGTKIHIISYSDLIKNKQAVNREIDQIDIKKLNEKNKNKDT